MHHRLPSEPFLVRELGVSRMTIHRALKELTAEHVLRRVAGVGTFVAPGKGHESFLQVDDIRDQILGRGNAHTAEVVLLRRERAPANLASLFALPPRSALFHSRIVHYENKLPVMVEDKYVRPELVPGYLEQDFTTMSTTHYLRSTLVATKSEQCVEAIQPCKTIRKLLLVKRGPCLLFCRRVWVHDTVAIHSQRVYPGAPYRLGHHFDRPAGIAEELA